jgi:hydrogenase maturation protein HypF
VPKARTAAGSQARVRVRAVCTGVVQGVGFRPAVFRHALRYGLAGFVANSPEGAVIEVEGEEEAVQGFLASLPAALPPLARLGAVTWAAVPVVGEARFQVAESLPGARREALVPPDIAICADCRREMEDPRDRRYRYPFTTCTNCGPRFSLAVALPYDRSRTAMACFPLCPGCQREYGDPGNRRFHAEPVCCPACGPTLRLLDARGDEVARGEAALAKAKALLAEGRIVAVKGLGGFQLACRADRQAAVLRLRRRKRRQGKPFAVMVHDLATAHELVLLSSEDERLLASPQAPILLAPRRPRAPLAHGLAPGLVDAGVMLPTTPLHVELFRTASYNALVMTSGNANDEPICRGNREALERLGGIADAFLLHDRDVVRRVDDSVARSGPDGPFLVRRSRGYVPLPLPLPVAAPEPILALGGFLQTTVTLAVEGQAFPSQHVGDLDTEAARAFLEEVIANLEGFLAATPRVLALDLHPDYPSRQLAWRLAAERGGEVLELQHHLAHGAAVLGEHGRFPRAGEQVGILALDGTGFGPDGTAWGGELLLLSGELAWERRGFLKPLPLLGGERAVQEPVRVAVAALVAAGEEKLAWKLPWQRRELVEALLPLARGPWPLASGAGRVFEAAGAILGLGEVNRFEGELAMRLEAVASRAAAAVAPWPGLETLVVPPVVRTDLLLAELARRRLARRERALAAAAFHASFAWLVAQLAAEVFPPGCLVAVGGGCLVNRLLRAWLSAQLSTRGFQVLLPQRVPPGDAGLSYGQAVLSAVSLQRGVRPVFQGGGQCASRCP